MIRVAALAAPTRTAFAGLAVGVAAFLLLESVARLGVHIPQADLRHDYVIAFTWAAIIAVSIPLWPVAAQDRRPLVIVWLAKCGVALGFMLLYEANYSFLDAYWYFRESAVPTLGVGSPDATGGTELIMQFTRLQLAVLPESYHAVKVTFAVIGLIAVYVLYRAAVLATQVERHWLLYTLAFTPSILFWSSILGKDPVVLLGIACFVYGVVSWHRRPGIGAVVIAGTGLIVAGMLRGWLPPILIVAVVPLLFHAVRGTAARLVIAFGCVAVAALLIMRLAASFGIGSLDEFLETASVLSNAWAIGGSARTLPVDISTLGGLLVFLPLGMFTALFRPLPGEVASAFGLMAGLENLALLVLAASTLRRGLLQRLREPLLQAAVALLLAWSAAYAIVSYQNLGAAVRFRAQVLPVLVLLLLALRRPTVQPARGDA